MMVESHCHIISEDQRRYPRDTGPNPAPWVRDLPAQEFQKLMEGAGADRAIHVQVSLLKTSKAFESLAIYLAPK